MIEQLLEDLRKFTGWRKTIAEMAGITPTSVYRNLSGITKEVNPDVLAAARKFLRERGHQN